MLSEAASQSEFYRSNRPTNGLEKNKRRLVYGFGINDADYLVASVNGGTCAAYKTWQAIIRRCHAKEWSERFPTYDGCLIDDRWRNFMAFRAWWIKNHVDGWHIDKDLTSFSGGIYGPDSCVYVPKEINLLLTVDHAKDRPHLVGTSFDNRRGRFYALCRSNGKSRHLGCFDTEGQAHAAWVKAKLVELEKLKSQMDGIDKRIYLVSKERIMAGVA